MGRYENHLDPDLSWMTDMMVDVNDFEPVESTIPLFENALELPCPSPSSPFSALFQMDAANSAHHANAAWNTNTMFDCAPYFKGWTLDQDQSIKLQSQSMPNAPLVTSNTTGTEDFTGDKRLFSQPFSSLNSQLNLLYLERRPDSSQSTPWANSPSVLEEAQAFVSEPVFSEPSWTAALTFLDCTRYSSYPDFGLESLLVEPNISHRQLESTESVNVSNHTNDDSDMSITAPTPSPQVPEDVPQERCDLDDFQWFLGTAASGLLRTKSSVSGLDGLKSGEGPVQTLAIGQTDVPDIWNFASLFNEGGPFQPDCAAATRTLHEPSVPHSALSQGESPTATTVTKAALSGFLPAISHRGAPPMICSPHYSSDDSSAVCACAVDIQQWHLHCCAHGQFYSNSALGPQRQGLEASAILHSQGYMRQPLTSTSIIISHKRRRRLTPTESEYLMAQFHKNERPTAQERDMFAKRLNLDRKTVQVWFQNRRAKLKRDVPTSFVDNSGREN